MWYLFVILIFFGFSTVTILNYNFLERRVNFMFLSLLIVSLKHFIFLGIFVGQKHFILILVAKKFFGCLCCCLENLNYAFFLEPNLNVIQAGIFFCFLNKKLLQYFFYSRMWCMIFFH